MRYMEFLSRLERNKASIFSLRDIQNIFPEANLRTVKNNLTNWLKKGYISRIKRDLYCPKTREMPDFYIANRLYHPSYISLESALSLYSIIPEVAVNITSITTRPTREFRNIYGLFIYRSLKKNAFIGYHIIRYEGYKVLIADKEKALVDFLYFKKGMRIDFDEERLNREILKKINWKKAIGYAKLFNHVTVDKTKNCEDWTRC